MAAAWVVLVVGLGGGDGGVLYTISYLVVGVVARFPGRRGGIGAGLLCAAALAVGYLGGERFGFGGAVGMAALVLAMVGVFGIIRANSELREAREELARLAVAEERERLARDPARRARA